MEKLISKTMEFLTGSKIYAKHSSIKGKKSGGMEDFGSHKNWRKDTSTGSSSVN